MADDIEIGIGADASSAVSGINKMVQGLNDAVRAAGRLEQVYRSISAQAARGNEDAIARLKDLRDQIKLESEALQIRKSRVMQTESVRGRGRTLADDSLADFTVQAYTKGFNVNNKQIEARIRQAASKAAERLVTATAEALEAQLNSTKIATYAKQLRNSTPEARNASIIQIQDRESRRVQQYGGYSSLAEYQAAKDAERNAKYLERVRTATLARQDAEYNRAAAVRMREEARRKQDEEKGSFSNQSLKSGELLRDRAGRFFDYGGLGAAVLAVGSMAKSLVDLDDAMLRFQAITQTSNLEMVTFKKNILDMGQASRYSIKDLTEAAITLGQTGLSGSAVTTALAPIVQLATASGSNIGQSVEVVTAAMGAYNMEASRAGEVANTMTAALNLTKLTMQQLSLGIQYAANVARESDISFTELTAVIGGLAQAGIRSGSTLGTGTRQLIQELSAPSDKLKNILKELNIQLGDIDIRGNTFTGVLENLRSKGFGTAEALRALDLRAASAFSALAGQTDTVKRLQESLLLTNAAAEGSATANQSLSASFTRLNNTMVGLADKAFGPVMTAMKGATDGANALFSALGSSESVNKIVAFGASAAVGAVAISQLARGMSVLSAAIFGLGTAGTALAAVNTGLAAIATNPLVVGGVLAAGGLAAVLLSGSSAAEKLAERLDRVKKSLNDLQSSQIQTQASLQTLETMLDSLIRRRDKLNEDPLLRRTAIIEAQKAFEQWGLTVDATSTSIDSLIKALQSLRGVMQEDMTRNLSQQLIDLEIKFKLLKQQMAEDKVGTVKNLFSASGGNMFSGDRRTFLSSQFGRLGVTNGEDIMNFMMQNPDNINIGDVRGTSNKYFTSLRDELGRVQGNIRNIERKDVIDAPTQAELDRLRQAEVLITALIKELGDFVSRATNLQGNIRQREEAALAGRASAIQDGSTYKGLIARRDELFGQVTSGERVILSNENLSAGQKANAIRDLRSSVAQEVEAVTKELNTYTDELKKSGVNDEVIRRAFDALTAQLKALADGVTGAIDLKKTEISEGLLANRQQKSRLDRELQQNMRILQNTTDKAIFDAVDQRIQQILKEMAANSASTLRFEMGLPRKLSAEQELAVQENADASIRRELDYLEKRNEIEKRRIDQSLAAEDRMLAAQRAEIDKQIASMQKELNDPRTTEEKAKKLKSAIEALIEKGIQILERQGEIDVRRSVSKTPEGYNLVPGVIDKGTVAGQIVDALRGLRREDLAGVALGFGAAESSFDPNARNKSGATGLFQFMPRTWSRFGRGGDINKVEDQVRAFVDYVDILGKVFTDKTGRVATPRELYAMWQQGEGGAGRLFSANPNASAFETLAPAYRDRNTAAKAITGNGGTLDMTVSQFLEVVMGHFDKSVAKNGGKIVKTTNDVATEEARARTEAGRTAYGQKATDAEKGVSDKIWENLKKKASDEDKVDMRNIESKRKLLSQSFDPGEAQKTLKEILDLYKQMAERAVETLKKSPEFQGLSADQQKERISEIRSKYREMAEREALGGAATAGKTVSTKDKQELDRLKKQKELMDENRSGYSAEEYRSVEKALEAQQKKVDFADRELKLTQELATVNETIKQITESGLGTERELTDLTARKAALEREVGEAKKTSAIVSDSEARKASGGNIGNALSAGADKFFKGNGMKNAQGEWKSMTEQMSDMWGQALGSMDSALSTLFVNLASGTMKAKDAFKAFAMSVIQDMMKIVSQALSKQILAALFGGADSKGNSIFGSLGSGLFGGGGGGGAAAEGGGGFFSSIASFLGFYNGGPMRFSTGGMIPHYAGGGATANRDSRLIMAQPGEFMIRKTAVDAVGRDTLEQINNLGPNKVSKPGPMPQPKQPKPSNVNVWVVSPEQVPPPSPRDIIATVAQDIQNRGTIRQLVKQVSVGHV